MSYVSQSLDWILYDIRLRKLYIQGWWTWIIYVNENSVSPQPHFPSCVLSYITRDWILYNIRLRKLYIQGWWTWIIYVNENSVSPQPHFPSCVLSYTRNRYAPYFFWSALWSNSMMRLTGMWRFHTTNHYFTPRNHILWLVF